MEKVLPMNNESIKNYIIDFYSKNRVMLKALSYEKTDNGQVIIEFDFYTKDQTGDWLKNLKEGFLL